MLGLERPPVWVGAALAACGVAVATGLVYPLEEVAPTVSLSVVYLPVVLSVSAYWGLGLGLLTSLAAAAAFNFFHLPPVGRFTIADSRNWVALGAFVVTAAAVSAVADVARGRALEAERRRAEADLAASLAREMLSGTELEPALRATAHLIAASLGLPSAAIELGAQASDERRLAIPLLDRDEPLATLIVPSDLPAHVIALLHEGVVPSLQALVAIAVHRQAAQAEAVETAALRHSDELKTALLRAVSHDLRSPLTAIVTAGHALGESSLTEEERSLLGAAVVEEGERLSRLVDKLLDLSRLQAGRAAPERSWISLEEVVLAAQDGLAAGGERVRLGVEGDLPPILADAAQLERVFANLLENALRVSGDEPVSVSIRQAAGRLIVRVTDRGPGIPAQEQERIFEPFYQSGPIRAENGGGRTWRGSGLGLAIARGFVEANGGTIVVDSLPGQGTTFSVNLPLPQALEVGS